MVEGESTDNDEERRNSDAEPEVIVQVWNDQISWRGRCHGVVDAGTYTSASSASFIQAAASASVQNNSIIIVII